MSQFKRIKVFISYSHSDREQAAGLRHYLPTQVFDVFFDRDRLHPGWQWESALLQVVRDSDAFVLLIGADTLDRDYVTRELDTFLTTAETVGSRHLIPVLIDGCEGVPVRVAGFQAMDLRGEDAQARARTIGQAIHGAFFIPPAERAQADRRPAEEPEGGFGAMMQKAWDAGEVFLSPQAWSQMMNLGIVESNIRCSHREFDPVRMGAKQCESDAKVICPACTTGACEEPYHLFGRFCTVLPPGDMFSPGTKLFFWCGTCYSPVCVRCLGIQDDYPCPPDQVLSYRFYCPACRSQIQVTPALNVDYEGVARECLRWTKAGGPPGIPNR